MQYRRPICASALCSIFLISCGTEPPPATYNPALTGVTSFHAFGDSLTVGVNASPPEKSYVALIAAKFGLKPDNKGWSSTMLHEPGEAAAILNTPVNDKTVSTLLPGLNNVRYFGANVAALRMYRNTLYALAAWLTIPDSKKLKARDGGIFYTGQWGDLPTYNANLGRFSATPGSSASAMVYGETIYVQSEQFATNGGTFTISIDSAIHGPYSAAGTQLGGMSKLPYNPYGLRFSGLRSGPHAVLFTATGVGQVAIDWIAALSGRTKQSGPWLFLGNTIRLNKTSYALYPPFNVGTNAAVNDYNLVAKQVATDLASDHLGVVYVDASAAYDPDNGVDLNPAADRIHPANAGYARIAQAFIRAMSFTP